MIVLTLDWWGGTESDYDAFFWGASGSAGYPRATGGLR
jgi:hypothetical protein